MKSNNIKWRSIIGLVLLYNAVIMGWEWMWGVLFLIWVIPDIFSGVTYFIEPVHKKENPFLYWAIILSWLWMSVYLIAMELFPFLHYYN